MELILQQSGPYRFVPYNDEPDAEMEKLQLYYCKRSLNVYTHASNSAVMGELSRYPLSYNTWVAIIKYWMRLNNGTENMILNAAFQLAYNENHRWVQAVYHVLNHNGFKEVWLNPPPPESNFHVIIKQRLRDQYMQHWKAKISSSSWVSLLNTLKGTFERSRYIDTIKDPEPSAYRYEPFFDIREKENHWYIYLPSLHQWLWLDVSSILLSAQSLMINGKWCAVL